MGVYIPPSSGNNNNNGSSSGSNNSKGGSGSSGSGSTIVIPNPSSFIPSNPSIGLKLWGPLVPASDNLPALYLLTSLQISIGLLSFSKVRALRSSNLARLNIPNTFSRKFTKWICAIGGSYVIFQSGLEFTRLSLPYDPWFEEAKFYRKLAIKNGDQPSWWFGAYNYYKPMDFNEWNSKVEKWIKNTANFMEAEDKKMEKSENTISIKSPGHKANHSPVLANLAKKGKYFDIHQSLHETNLKRYKELLSTDLKDVNELNKAERIDRILEGTSDVKYNEHYLKPHIQLGNHRMETDEDFEMVWLNFEPWDELKLETDYDIRFIPRWRWSSNEDIIDNNKDLITTTTNDNKNKEKSEHRVNEINESHI